MKNIFRYILSFILVFGVVGFIITCSFLLFFDSIVLTESEVRSAAPIVFINAVVITVLLLLIDSFRRKLTVDRSVREIQRVLDRLTKGDFSARVSEEYITFKYTNFESIAKDLNRLAEELSGVETLRSDFIANVSHELKTPLAVMHNYGTMLQKLDINDEERLEYAKAITDSSGRLAELITNILKLNKLENQKIYPKTECYDLGESLCESLLQFENLWEEKHIEIETDIADDVTVQADRELLSLVWNNLFSNAFKFTCEGGAVSVILTADEKYASVKISDTGCGMSPEVGKHIFEKFYQGDTSHSTKGNGLGLALVKRVVDILRGEITVESVPNKGSTFTVRIKRR